MTDQTPTGALPTTDLSLVGEEHAKLYEATNGEQGYIWNGAPILLVTTKGHKSGQTRVTPLIFVDDAAGPAIIASKGGAPEHPAWYQNLAADPRVKVQIKGDVFEARARTTSGPERARIWKAAVKAWPQYEDYQAATSREIPVVVLERVNG